MKRGEVNVFVVNSMASARIGVTVVGNQSIRGISVYSEGDPAQTAKTGGIHYFLSVSDDSGRGEKIRALLKSQGSAYAGEDRTRTRGRALERPVDSTHVNLTHGWVRGIVIHQTSECAADSGELTRASFHEVVQGGAARLG